MKKSIKYLEHVNSFTTREELYNIGKQIQIDAIDAAVRKCAKKAEVKVIYDNETFSTSAWELQRDNDGSIFSVIPDKKSILSVAKELKKELE